MIERFIRLGGVTLLMFVAACATAPNEDAHEDDDVKVDVENAPVAPQLNCSRSTTCIYAEGHTWCRKMVKKCDAERCWCE